MIENTQALRAEVESVRSHREVRKTRYAHRLGRVDDATPEGAASLALRNDLWLRRERQKRLGFRDRVLRGAS